MNYEEQMCMTCGEAMILETEGDKTYWVCYNCADKYPNNPKYNVIAQISEQVSKDVTWKYWLNSDRGQLTAEQIQETIFIENEMKKQLEENKW